VSDFIERLPIAIRIDLGTDLEAAEPTDVARSLDTRHVTGLLAPLVVRADGSDVLKRVGLPGYVVQSGDREASLLDEAAKLLGLLSDVALNIVNVVTRTIYWTRPDQGGDASVEPFASCTFFDMPGATFLTAGAARVLPPQLVTAQPSAYAVAEAILHEALHQLLNREHGGNPLFRPEARGVDVDIPWHGTRWELERAFHTAFVYAGLAALRRRAVDRALAPELIALNAVEEAGKSLSSLRESISAEQHTLTESGARIWAEICRD